MKITKGKVGIDVHVLSKLVAAPFEVAEAIRVLQIRGGVLKTEAVPGRKQLQALDQATCEVNTCLVTGGQDLDTVIRRYNDALETVLNQVSITTEEKVERPISLNIPSILPKKSKPLFYAIGKQGVSNTLSLIGDLGCAPGTLSKNLEPLLILGVAERQKHVPVVGRRNWEYVYRMTNRGQKLFFELFNEHANLYFNYDPDAGRSGHHLATNIATRCLYEYVPFGFYYGHEGKYTEKLSSYGIKTTIKPDSAGYIDNLLTYIEVESAGDYYSFRLKMKKYLLSDISNLLVIPISHIFLSQYIEMIRNTHVDDEYIADEPLSVYLVTLQDLVDGHPPELVAIRNRDGSRDGNIEDSWKTIYSPW